MKRQFLLVQRSIEALTEELGMDPGSSAALGTFIRNIEEVRSFDEIESMGVESGGDHKRSWGHCGA